MGGIFWLVVIGTSIWVLVDAKNIGVKKGQLQGLANLGPWGWFFACLLLWIIAFPVYLAKRGQFKPLNAAAASVAQAPAPAMTAAGLPAGAAVPLAQAAPAEKRISVIGWIGIGLIALIAGAVIFGASAGNHAASDFPECTSSDASDNFKNVFDNSQYAKTLNLTAIDVIDQKKLSESPDGKKLVCQGTLMLNNAEKTTYTFTFTPAKDGQFYIEGQPLGG